MPRVLSEAHRQFGTNLRAARQRAGLSLEALAARSGVTWSYIGTLERGNANPALTTLLRLAAALNATPAQLLDRIDPSTAPPRQRAKRLRPDKRTDP